MKVFRAPALGLAVGSLALGCLVAATLPVTAAHAEAVILVDVDSGKVLRAENASYPWYPASTTKLMTLYMTLSAIRDHRITFDTLFSVSRNANTQAPTKMGFPVGTQVTVDNALKMMMVKSANDMAVLLAEGIGGSIDDFAQQMTDTAHRLGMSETNYVNPNGLPADDQVTSARDLAILARALIREFPQYSFYWHIPAIRFGKRVVRNYNPLLGRYPGADGMKTGFICASGFNLVATATRDNKRLIAVVLGAPSGAARAIKAAEMLEGGFAQNPLAWLTPSLGTVDQLASMNAAPPNLKDEVCGPHRKRPAAEDEDADADASGDSQASADSGQHHALLLSALRAPTNPVLLSDLGPVLPIVVYTGPTRTPAELAKLQTEVPAEPAKKAAKPKTATAARPETKAAAKSTDDKPPAKPAAATPSDKPAAKPAAAKPAAKPAAKKPATGQTTQAGPTDGKGKSGNPWTGIAPTALSTAPSAGSGNAAPK